MDSRRVKSPTLYHLSHESIRWNIQHTRSLSVVCVSFIEYNTHTPTSLAMASDATKPRVGASALLNAAAELGVDEQAPRDEELLNSFIRLHPMLSLEMLSPQVMQQLAGMASRTPVTLETLELVGKRYEDGFFRPANTAIGERSCANGNDCMCKFLAEMRHGEDTPLAFVGTEFLLPSSKARWETSGTLPAEQNKCLLCIRYMTNFVYIMARINPSFRITTDWCGMQTHQNVCLDEARANATDGVKVASHSNIVGTVDGYIPEAMLFSDEDFAATYAASGTDTGQLVWRPFVRFCASHYVYGHDASGRPRITQHGIGTDVAVLAATDAPKRSTERTGQSTDGQTERRGEGGSVSPTTPKQHLNGAAPTATVASCTARAMMAAAIAAPRMQCPRRL